MADESTKKMLEGQLQNELVVDLLEVHDKIFLSQQGLETLCSLLNSPPMPTEMMKDLMSRQPIPKK